MVFLKRKRLIIWLFKAYFKKWGKTIGVSFAVGILLFLLLFTNRNFLASKLVFTTSERVGVAGIYSKQDFPNDLPDFILDKLSRGLTRVDGRGNVLPDIAKRWDIKDGGKTFVFYLKDNVYFSDGKPVDSSSINYNFSDVTIEKPSKQVIVFKLKEKYSPFLVTLANNKVFKKNFVGVSDFELKKVKENAGFIDYIDLYSQKDRKAIKYDFYDTQDLLKNGYLLGEVDRIVDINDPIYNGRIDLTKFKNSNTTKAPNNSKIVTIFFDNQDPVLSDKKVRKALAYSLPNDFSEGKRNYTPYIPDFWANNPLEIYQKDVELSKALLQESSASQSGKTKITLKTLPQYKNVADEIAKEWRLVDFDTKVEVVDVIPDVYQAFLGDLPVLKDPDQYTLWHSGQVNNITHYKNLRIDKLLEDGRQTYDRSERKQIYTDFQKYLVDDMPAAFLFLPYTYTISRN